MTWPSENAFPSAEKKDFHILGSNKLSVIVVLNQKMVSNGSNGQKCVEMNVRVMQVKNAEELMLWMFGRRRQQILTVFALGITMARIEFWMRKNEWI